MYSSQSENTNEDNKKSRKADGAFRTISEVADELEVQQHVLRFWETKFSQVKPLKRGGGRRYYRPEDVDVLKKIHHLLYSDGYTIRGAQNLVKGLSKNQVASLKLKQPVPEQSNDSAVGMPENKVAQAHDQALQAQSDKNKQAVIAMIDELKTLRDMLK